jgi:hypothetical protein
MGGAHPKFSATVDATACFRLSPLYYIVVASFIFENIWLNVPNYVDKVKVVGKL